MFGRKGDDEHQLLTWDQLQQWKLEILLTNLPVAGNEAQNT